MFFIQKDMVNCKAYAVSNSNDGTFASSPSGNFTVFRIEVTIFMANSRMSTFN